MAISEAQRRIGPSLNWAGTVNNAIPVDEYPKQGTATAFSLVDRDGTVRVVMQE